MMCDIDSNDNYDGDISISSTNQRKRKLKKGQKGHWTREEVILINVINHRFI